MIGRKLLAMTLVAGSLTGCSVGMALSGDETPDLSVIKIGALRDEVELQLGQPYKMTELPGGVQEAAYKFDVGNGSQRAKSHRSWGPRRRQPRTLGNHRHTDRGSDRQRARDHCHR